MERVGWVGWSGVGWHNVEMDVDVAVALHEGAVYELCEK